MKMSGSSRINKIKNKYIFWNWREKTWKKILYAGFLEPQLNSFLEMAPGNIKGKFTENEKLLCYHGPLLYEAKCIKLKKDNANAIQYFIHYQGWNKNCKNFLHWYYDYYSTSS